MYNVFGNGLLAEQVSDVISFVCLFQPSLLVSLNVPVSSYMGAINELGDS